MPDDLIVLRPEGLYCPPGDFFIDPWRPVHRAVLTHAHADHARAGHGHYLAIGASAGVLRERLGALALQACSYGETVHHQGVKVSLHPAGHVLGSAQVRVEHAGRVWVASGDYKVTVPGGRPDPTCEPFEPVPCDVFITESTFGLPVYRWQTDEAVFADINAWWQANAAQGRPSLLLGYSFGKAQRILAGVDASIGPIVCHGAVEPINRAYREAGVALPRTEGLAALREKAVAARALVIAPPGAAAGAFGQKLSEASVAFASGWMQLRGARRRGGYDRGFVLSDHADWPGLQRAIAATGAGRVIVTHGFEAVMVRWLQQQGLEAGSFHTEYGDDRLEAADTASAAAPAEAPQGAAGQAGHAQGPAGAEPPA